MGSDRKHVSKRRGRTNGEKEAGRKPGGLRQIITLITMALAAVAVFKELRTPAEERTWNGKVAGVVPYDFRMPTVSRVKERVWNPQGEHVVGPRVFGVGWTVNAGKLVSEVRRRIAG
jgi:hypothetical protein